jgi:hypothetical protein
VSDQPAVASHMSIGTQKGAQTHSRCRFTAIHADAISRARSRSSFPRPYICRFTSLSFVICPSVWPFDQGSHKAALTAAKSALMPLPNDPIRLLSLSVTHGASAAVSRARNMPWKRSSPADLDAQVHGTAMRRKIQQTPLIATVDLNGCHPAGRARRRSRGRMTRDHDAIALRGHRVDDQSCGRHRPR